MSSEQSFFSLSLAITSSCNQSVSFLLILSYLPPSLRFPSLPDDHTRLALLDTRLTIFF